MPQIFPVMMAADIEFLAQVFLTPILAPTIVSTEIPRPNTGDDVVNGFCRVEAGDVVPLLPHNAMFNASFLIHAYASAIGGGEDQCSLISRTAIANCAAVAGRSIAGWYINRVVTVIGGRRLDDPEINLLRYRSAVTWEISSHLP
jgi:hypothetical protein